MAPTATSMLTVEPRLTLVPAAGSCLTIDPTGAVGSIVCPICGESLRPAARSTAPAANEPFAFFRFGTTVCLGINSTTATTATAISGATTASHHGSHDRWR